MLRKETTRMSGILSSAAVIVMLAFAVVPAFATDYYIDGENGDDLNDGLSWATAWKTFDMEADGTTGVLTAGDVVHVKAGTYVPPAGGQFAGGFKIQMSGVSGNPITYKAEGRVVVDAQFAADNCIMFGKSGVAANYITLDGFEFTRAKTLCLAAGRAGGAFAHGATIKNCTIHDIGNASSGFAYGCFLDWSNDGTYTRNLIYNIKNDVESQGIWIRNGGTPVGPWKIYNNTLYRAGQDGVGIAAGAGTNVDFKNNIIVTTPWELANWGAGTITNDYNFWFNTPNPPIYPSDQYQGAHDIIGQDPLFVSIESGNFRLQSGSPAIDAGVDVGTGPYTDAPDMGAYEYNPSSPATITGTVTDEVTSAAIVGATVEALGTGISTTTGDGGSYTLSLPIDGPYKVQASTTGYMTAQAMVYTVAGDTVTQDFSLNAPRNIQGKVLWNKDGNPPIPGAKVEVVGASVPTETFSGDDGSYSLDVPSGSRTFRVTIAGFEPLEETLTIPGGGTLEHDFILSQVPPKDWYVDGSFGNDSNGGTSWEDAWLTIDRGDALGVVGPGDTVWVWPDTYTSSVRLLTSGGTSLVPVTYKAHQDPENPGARPIVDTTADHGIDVFNPYVIIDGFEIATTRIGIVAFAQYTTIRNCIFRNMTGGVAVGVDIAQPKGFVSHNNLMRDIDQSGTGVSSALYAEGGVDGANIFNNTVVRCRRFMGGTGNYSNSEVRNNIISDMSAAAISHSVTPTGFVTSNNVFWNCTGGLFNDPAIGLGSGDFVADALLDAEYKPQAGSPAINTGIDVGLPYLGPAPDRGWFETDSTVAMGWVRGTITDGLAVLFVSGAQIAEPGTANVTYSDENGKYGMMLSAGTHTIVVSKSGYASQEAEVYVTGGSEFIQNFDLTMPTIAVDRLSALKHIATPARVFIRLSKTVMADSGPLPADYYIEEPDRSFGIRVVPQAGLPEVHEGDLVMLTGRLDRDENSELCIFADGIDGIWSGTKLRPLGMSNKTLLTHDGEAMGLLVRIWGQSHL